MKNASAATEPATSIEPTSSAVAASSAEQNSADILPAELRTFFAIRKSIVPPTLLPEEVTQLDAAQALYDSWCAVEHKYSPFGMEQAENKLKALLGTDPSAVANIVADLESLYSQKASTAAYDSARIGKYKASVEIQPMLNAVYEREIAIATARLEQLKALDLSAFELSAAPAIERCIGHLSHLSAGRELATRDLGITAGFMASPRQLAGGLIQ